MGPASAPAVGVQDKFLPGLVRDRRFASDVLKLTSGTVLAQVISILAAPLMTRLFSPQTFGAVLLFTSITGVMSVVVCLRYDRSIIVPATDRDAAALLGVSTLAVILVTAVSSLILAPPVKSLLLARLQAGNLGPYLWLCPAYVFFYGLLISLSTWATRKKHFSTITFSSLAGSVTYVGFSLTAGFMGYRGGGTLIVGTFLGLLISVLPLLARTWRDCWPQLFKALTLAHMREMLHRYHRFPKYGTGAAILYSLSWELPAFFLSGFFSMQVVGQYALGNRLIRMPMTFIGLNIARVFSQRAAEARHHGTLAPLVDRTFQLLVVIGLFPFLLLTLVGRDLFGLVFGTPWEEAGVYTQILSLWAFFWFISFPLGSVLDILDEQAFELRMNIVILGSRLAALAIGCYTGNPRVALACFAGTGVLVYAYYSLAILRKCGLPFRRPLRTLVLETAKFFPFAAAVIGAKIASVPPVGVLALSIVTLIAYYASVVRKVSMFQPLLLRLFGKDALLGFSAKRSGKAPEFTYRDDLAS